MMNTELYDFTPLARMMLMGVVVAMGPLAWVWLRNRKATPSARLYALTLLTLFLTFDLVLFGAFTRLTDSGLGCPDWPGCYGNASPIGAASEIATAQAAIPTGAVTHSKAWVEMIHRYLATGVGVLILTLTAVSWIQRRHNQGGVPISPWWATATLAWVCVQGAFGALTVTMKLFPAIVTLHLLGGIALLVLLCAQAVRYAQAWRERPAVPLGFLTRSLLIVALASVVIQVALGGWVSTNYAVLACNQFPMCQDSWWPYMDFHQGFQIWRALGMTADGEHIGFAALTAIHYTHRLFACVVFGSLGFVAWRLHGIHELRLQAKWLIGLSLAQFVTGLSNVVLDWPLAAAVAHTGGAAALVTVLTWALLSSRAALDTVSASRMSPSRLSV
jgi:cytochrome c oxidase assembly protein subunit 15